MGTRPLLLTDEEVRQRARPADAVACMVSALADHVTGTLVAPPRAVAPMADGRIVMTAGASSDIYGYRVYDTLGSDGGDQVVVAHDRATGRVAAVAVGPLIGALRTGALGGAAAALLGPPSGEVTIGVVGAGLQAWTQLWAITGVLETARVRIASRTRESREALSKRVADELHVHAEPASTAEQAVRGADVVVLATTSNVSVVESSWLRADVLVIAVGHKQVGRAEFDASLFDVATMITTDSPEQLRAYDPPSLLSASDRADDVVHLGRIAAGLVDPVRTGRRVHQSVGLAGTEPLLLHRLIENPDFS